jgi:uncharacterized cupin superfamily protein
MTEALSGIDDYPNVYSEIGTYDKSKVEVADLGGVEAIRVTNQPGRRWSECVKPIVGTDSCQVSHFIHVLSGRIRVRMDDGSEAEFDPGDVGSIPPGHDAWIVGNEPFISIDFPDCRTMTESSDTRPPQA